MTGAQLPESQWKSLLQWFSVGLNKKKKRQYWNRFLLWLTLLRLAAGIKDLDICLDKVAGCWYKQHFLFLFYFLRPETDGWLPSASRVLSPKSEQVFISQHPLSCLPLIGQHTPQPIYQSWAGNSNRATSFSTIPTTLSKNPRPIKLSKPSPPATFGPHTGMLSVKIRGSAQSLYECKHRDAPVPLFSWLQDELHRLRA